MAKIVLNAGHTLKGKGTGAVGYLNEGIEARAIVKELRRRLEEKGHDVIVINIDEAESQAEYLQAVVCVANRHRDADAFISIHLNAGGGRGCEAYTWRGRKHSLAVGVCNKLSKLGFRNRGVKDGSNLYVIKKTYVEATLIEVCFVDNKEDADLYRKAGAKRIAQTIMRGICDAY